MPTELKDSTVAIVGFNARPIACSAKRSKARVLVSDYWGDVDLPFCCDQWVAIIGSDILDSKGERTRPIHALLVEKMLDRFSNQEVDHCIVGSGFDDHTDSLLALEQLWPITGNSSALMRKARDTRILQNLAESMEIRYPKRTVITKKEVADKRPARFEYPYIIRPIKSGGGLGIRLVNSSNDVEDALDHAIESRGIGAVLIQEYISGLDVSCTVLSTGEEAKALSVQGQLIGMPSAGRNCDFLYCGNYLPINLGKKVREQIKEFSESVCIELGLLGLNGLDFVVDRQNLVWLMEVNPRIPGTLEMLELAGETSLLELHVKSVNGDIPYDLPKFKPACKLVAYARAKGKVPDLTEFPSTVDRSPNGAPLQKGEPICTVIMTNTDLNTCYGHAVSVIRKISHFSAIK